MKWRGRERSRNVEDRRGARGRTVRRAGGGLGVFAILAIALGLFFPDAASYLGPILRTLDGAQSGGAVVQPAGGGVQDDAREFVEVTLRDTEKVWTEIFASGAMRGGQRYQPPTLVLFTGATSSPCGPAQASTGPFYCPADRTIYIDPAFYRVMAERLRAPGDFAQAYVIAHEVAHHVQMISGRLMEVNRARAAMGAVAGNRLTVRLELQADCFSGVWAKRIEQRENTLEPGDLEEALRAAYQVGDDVIMRMSGRRVDESQFTHGRAEQRRRWFRTGYQAGEVRACDTFNRSFDDL